MPNRTTQKTRNQSQFVRQLAQLRRSAQVFPFATGLQLQFQLQLHQHQSEFAALTCHPHSPWLWTSVGD